jgi:hypothetical protein
MSKQLFPAPDVDGTTVAGDYRDDAPTGPSKLSSSSKAGSRSPVKPRFPDVPIPDAAELPFVDAEQYLATKRPFCVRVDGARGGVLGALRELDAELTAAGYPSIFSKKKPVDWAGREVMPGSIGLYTRG